MNTPYSNGTQAKNSQAERRQAPGDDGFQSLSVRITDITLSPNDLTNRQEAMLLGEFFATPTHRIAAEGAPPNEEGRVYQDEKPLVTRGPKSPHQSN